MSCLNELKYELHDVVLNGNYSHETHMDLFLINSSLKTIPDKYKIWKVVLIGPFRVQ